MYKGGRRKVILVQFDITALNPFHIVPPPPPPLEKVFLTMQL